MKNINWKTVFISAIIALITVWIFKPSSQSTQKESAFERIIRTKTIRCGYIIYNPALIKDPNTGKLSGISYDIMEEIEKQTGIKVEWVEEATFATPYEGIKTGRYDMICSAVWQNAPRSTAGDFSTPFYFSGIGVYVKNTNSKFQKGDLKKVNFSKTRIVAIDGEMTMVIAKQQFPKATIIGLPNTTDVPELLLHLLTGKSDITFVEPDVAEKFLAKNPNSIRKIGTLTAMANSMALPSNELGLKNFIDSNIKLLLRNGFIEKTLQKYESKPGILLRVKKEYQGN